VVGESGARNRAGARVVGTKANKLVKASNEVVEVNVSSRAQDRVAYVESKLGEYQVSIDRQLAERVASQVGDDLARVDSLARTLRSIYGTAPLTFANVEPYLGDAGDVPEWDLTTPLTAGTRPKPSWSRDGCSIQVSRGFADRQYSATALLAHGPPRRQWRSRGRRRRRAAGHQSLSGGKGLGGPPNASGVNGSARRST